MSMIYEVTNFTLVQSVQGGFEYCAEVKQSRKKWFQILRKEERPTLEYYYVKVNAFHEIIANTRPYGRFHVEAKTPWYSLQKIEPYTLADKVLVIDEDLRKTLNNAYLWYKFHESR